MPNREPHIQLDEILTDDLTYATLPSRHATCSVSDLPSPNYSLDSDETRQTERPLTQ
jgi:hypothetical protein